MKIKSHSFSLAVFIFYPFVGLESPHLFTHTDEQLEKGSHDLIYLQAQDESLTSPMTATLPRQVKYCDWGVKLKGGIVGKKGLGERTPH